MHTRCRGILNRDIQSVFHRRAQEIAVGDRFATIGDFCRAVRKLYQPNVSAALRRVANVANVEDRAVNFHGITVMRLSDYEKWLDSQRD